MVKLKTMNLGCGRKIMKNAVNLDKRRLKDVDVIHDLEETPLPFKDNEFDIIFSNHVLEHIKNLIPLMEDLHRITKPHGILKINVPHFSSFNAYTIDHVRFFGYGTFRVYERNKYYGYSVKFKVLKNELNFSKYPRIMIFNWLMNPIINYNKKFYERFLCWIIPCEEIQFELEVIK